MTNMELYAARIANQLDIIKDRHRDVLMADELNCYDIVNADVLVVEKDAVKSIEEVIK